MTLFVFRVRCPECGAVSDWNAAAGPRVRELECTPTCRAGGKGFVLDATRWDETKNAPTGDVIRDV